MNSQKLKVPRLKVPFELDSILEELIRAVLKAQPENIELFIADHLKILVDLRDSGDWATTGSAQASPTDIVKHIVENDHANTSSEISKAPTVSQEPTSLYSNGVEDPDSEMAERGSLHCVEATAVRTLAASTGTVAILGTTAKCNENVDYRQSVHSEQTYSEGNKEKLSITEKEEQESSEKELICEADITTPIDVVESTNIVTTAIIEVPPDGITDFHESPSNSDIYSLSENHLPKVIDSIVKQPNKTINSPKEAEHEFGGRESSTETNENSEIGSSSSEVISIVKQDSKESDHDVKGSRMSSESNRPNRLSFGQMSIESDQNTLEISSADDVKNESTDITSPESLRGSMEESLIVSPGSKKSNVKEISNTSLNTLGINDSDEDGSDLEVDFGTARKERPMVKHFDTISSNGESSYLTEDLHRLSVGSEVPELEQMTYPDVSEEVFDGDSQDYMDNVREVAASEVDRICEEAIDKMSDILMLKPCLKDVNNLSESSILSAVDSLIAERESDFDSLLDEPRDSRSISMFGDDTRSCRSESVHDTQTESACLQDDEEPSLTSVVDENMVLSQDNFRTVIIAKNRSQSISEDLPRPPNIEDLPPLPENLDQYDITEEELKAVELPENVRPIEPIINAAASKIQAGVRGYLTRKQIKGLTNEKAGDGETDSFDTESLRLYAKSKRLSLDSKLVDIENIRKLPKLKATLSECVEEESEVMDPNKAAIKIQNTFRNYRARKSICLGDRKPNEKTVQFKNSVNDDSKNVGDSLNDKFKLEENEPLIEGTQRSINRPHEEANVEDDNAVKQAAVKIQATYRGFRTRKSIQISASAATKIQAHFRGYKVRKSMKRSSSLNDLAGNSNSSSCSNISANQDPDLAKHVTKIQAGVRGYLVRKRHSLQNSAATKIQLNYRRYKSRKMSLTNPRFN